MTLTHLYGKFLIEEGVAQVKENTSFPTPNFIAICRACSTVECNRNVRPAAQHRYLTAVLAKTQVRQASLPTLYQLDMPC